MGIFRRRLKKDKVNETEFITYLNPDEKLIHINFDEYLGQTVTIYVNAGGAVGNGFTGVLLMCTCAYIKLLVRPSIAPMCSMGNSCNGKNLNPLFCTFCPHADKGPLGTIVDIPITAIVAFVHNALGHGHNYDTIT